MTAENVVEKTIFIQTDNKPDEMWFLFKGRWWKARVQEKVKTIEVEFK